MRLVTLGVGAAFSPRFQPAGLLVACRSTRVIIDAGPRAVPKGRIDAWLLTDDHAELAAAIRRLLREQPRLSWAFLKGRIAEQERADSRLTLLGRIGANERIGYLLLEMRDRLRVRGLFRGHSGALPLDRALLADAVGLSRVHVLRAMRALRARGLADLTDRILTIPSVRNLARFSGCPLTQAAGAQAIL
jgi:hypothetical protein